MFHQDQHEPRIAHDIQAAAEVRADGVQIQPRQLHLHLDRVLIRFAMPHARLKLRWLGIERKH